MSHSKSAPTGARYEFRTFAQDFNRVEALMRRDAGEARVVGGANLRINGEQ